MQMSPQGPMSLLADFQKTLDMQVSEMTPREQMCVAMAYTSKLPSYCQDIVDTLPPYTPLIEIAKVAERKYNRYRLRQEGAYSLPAPYTKEREKAKRNLEKQDDKRVEFLERKQAAL